ncbi:MAG: PAS domain S-box protein [Thermoanaerobaculia bacterium]
MRRTAKKSYSSRPDPRPAAAGIEGLHLASIIQSSDDAIISKTLDGVVTSWNPAAERIFGYTAAEIVGKPILILFPSDRHGEEQNILSRIARGEHVVHYETVRLRKNGEPIDVSVTISPIHDETGRVVGASKIARDITDRKRLEAEAWRRTEELARSNAELEQFAFVASHDLQEPLRGVVGCVELLQKRHGPQLNTDARELISLAVESSMRMQNLIEDLLEYSRVGRPHLEKRRVDLDGALDRALSSLAATIARTGAVVTRGELPVVSGDRRQLSQVFENLIGNAIKFRSECPLKIHISAQREREGWIISVADNGIGIETRFLEKIFGLFQRLHPRARYPGTGVGLPICRKVIERHGGRIWVDSTPGEGSTFSFLLPGGGTER